MTYMQKPKPQHPKAARNKLGLTTRDYEGPMSSLCAGCGHDSVTAALVQSFWRLSVQPHQVGKMSGIGCSSKTPGYFLRNAHGFNAVHGRMPSVTTGASLAHRNLMYVGVSGDGDTGSIGLGQYLHAVRRRLNMLYLIENNGVYGLTKGQFSALADYGSRSKGGEVNAMHAIDPVVMAIQLGAGFVARSFSGDKEQLIPLIMAGLQYEGFALIDVISPCVSFNNHDGSTKSYHYARDHIEPVSSVDLVMPEDPIEVSYPEGGNKDVDLPDGYRLRLQKVRSDYNWEDPVQAVNEVEAAKSAGRVLTGLLYMSKPQGDMHDLLQTSTTPLRDLPIDQLQLEPKALAMVNQEHR